MNEAEELWRWVEGYEGLYQISNHGRLKSFRKYRDGRVCSLINKKGWYFSVVLFDENRRRRTKKIHQLVAETFIGKVPKGFHVHHKDGNRQNNNVSNLEIIHPSKHAVKKIEMNPDSIKGMNNYNRYIHPKRVQQYTLDGFFIAEFANADIASQMTGVCQRNILQVANKTPYKNGNIRHQAGGYAWKFKEGGD